VIINQIHVLVFDAVVVLGILSVVAIRPTEDPAGLPYKLSRRLMNRVGGAHADFEQRHE
jgi:hypothetical protein